MAPVERKKTDMSPAKNLILAKAIMKTSPYYKNCLMA
jgi:hypothetical protein